MAKRNALPYSQTHSQGGHSVAAYRGYVIQPALCGDIFYVQKGGFTIGSAATYEQATAIIDMLAA